MIQIYMERYETIQGKKKRELEHQLGMKLLHNGLKDLFDIIPDCKNPLIIEKGEHGKPYLKEYPHIYFNISHTEGLVVCGIGPQEVGIDVERIRPYKKSVEKKVLSETERKYLENLPEEVHSEYFFRIWTLKECYVKAIGCGITIPLADISFGWKDDKITVTSRPDMFFYQIVLENEYILSVSTFKKEEISFAGNVGYYDSLGQYGRIWE